jgi:hypothetical protein
VPIRVLSQENQWDCVLVDDDPIVGATWNLAAQKSGKKLRYFSSPQGLVTELQSFSKSTPVYIDSNLGEGIKGESLGQYLHEQGFVNLYLATADAPSSFRHLLWPRGIQGKMAPWVRQGGTEAQKGLL